MSHASQPVIPSGLIRDVSLHARPAERAVSQLNEAEQLLAMADLLHEVNPPLSATLDGWRDRVRQMIGTPAAQEPQAERQLDDLAMEFRRLWIDLASQVVSGDFKSPPVGALPLLPVSDSGWFMYERVIGAAAIEERIRGAQAELPGWEGGAALFASGSAAIAATLMVLRHLAPDLWEKGVTLQLDMSGGYFETLRLVGLLSTPDCQCQTFQAVEPVLSRFAAGDTDVLFIELIAYDWSQSVLNPAALQQALSVRPAGRPWVLLLDTTLLGPLFELPPLLELLAHHPPMLVIDIRSGLKLDQVGLEYANAGVIQTYSPRSAGDDAKSAAELFQRQLRSFRKVLGTGLSRQQLAILDAPWLFHPHLSRHHARVVMEHSRRAARALAAVTGLFARVNHPVLSGDGHLAWAESPMVILEFQEGDDTEQNLEFLRAVIANEARERELLLYQGASFGFRHHRCEVMEVGGVYAHAGGRDRGFLKLCMGAHAGPSVEAVIGLFCELAAYPSFESLRQAYASLDVERTLTALPSLVALRSARPSSA